MISMRDTHAAETLGSPGSTAQQLQKSSLAATRPSSSSPLHRSTQVAFVLLLLWPGIHRRHNACGFFFLLWAADILSQ